MNPEPWILNPDRKFKNMGISHMWNQNGMIFICNNNKISGFISQIEAEEHGKEHKRNKLQAL